MVRLISFSIGSILLWAILVFDSLLKASANVEGDALDALKNNLADPHNVLQSWDATEANPCMWFRVACNSDNKVIRLDLGDENLTGQLVPQLGQLQSLQYFELYSNNISGKIPDELGNLTNLVSLDLSFNRLTGPIPDTLGSLKGLRFLRLQNNSLSGNIPMSLRAVESLQVLDLSNNQLEGDLPINGSYALFTPKSFQNNPGLKWPELPPSPRAALLPAASSNSSNLVPRPISPMPPAPSGILYSGGVVAGTAVLYITACAFVFSYWQIRKPQHHFFDVPAEKDSDEIHRDQLKHFSLFDLQVATDNFSYENIVGWGGSGKVYKGRLADGSLVAVKRLKEEHTPEIELQFQTETKMISMAVHRNLIRLIGFCVTPTEWLLVYPFMVNRCVASCLRERPETQPPLDWPARKRIALGAARGLAYLHDHCDPKIIHRDVKASNILLDEEFEAVIGDFGLAKLSGYRDTHVTTAVCGTVGHIAPEYLLTGRLTEKTDVFGYGVMLLELITGQRVFDLVRLANNDEVMLLDWVKGFLRDRKLEILVDANLKGNYDEKEFEQLIQVSLICTQVNRPLERPRMSVVVGMLEGDDFSEKWRTFLQNEEMSGPHFDYTHQADSNWIADSTSEISPA